MTGLQPGKNALATAERRYKPKYRYPKRDTDDIKEWHDGCKGRLLRIGLDSKGMIQGVTVSATVPQNQECGGNLGSYLGDCFRTTGRGLKLSDSRSRVIELYDDPISTALP